MLEGGHGGEVVRLLGRPHPFVRGAELLVMDNDGGAEEGHVIRALACVLVHRRRPPPLLAQLVQPNPVHLCAISLLSAQIRVVPSCYGESIGARLDWTHECWGLALSSPLLSAPVAGLLSSRFLSWGAPPIHGVNFF